MSATDIMRDRRSVAIGSQASHRRSDFAFERTQSMAFKELPWDNRLRPRKTLTEIGLYAITAGAGVAALVAVFV